MSKLTSDLIAISFDSPGSPSVTLTEQKACGWGFAWYPDERAASVVKDPNARADSALATVLTDWERFRSTLFLCHTGPDPRTSKSDTHPFKRSYAGRDWVFAHNGELSPDLKRRLAGAKVIEAPAFEPVGHTDTEVAFCWLMNRVHASGARSLRHLGYERLHRWLRILNQHGTFNVVMSDGRDLVGYHDEGGFRALHYIRRKPPHARAELSNDSVTIDLGEPLDLNRTMALFSTEPLSDEPWRQLKPGR